MKNLRYICCQPAIPYYTWQVEVMINNFIKMGITPNLIDIVCGIENNKIPDDWIKLKNNYNSVRFFFYNDTRKSKIYAPAIYFNLMKQHVVSAPEIQNDVLMMHDSDIVLTKTPDIFNTLLGDNIWYLSDTKSYINYDYIISKGGGIYENMCKIIGIDQLIPKLLNSNSGGAQYIVKNTTFEFWEKVEKNSIELYDYFCNVEELYTKKHKNDYPIQKWTAGMWSFLWNAWYFEHETIIDKKMDFGWVTNPYSDVYNYTILHNAGVLNGNTGLFFKGDYTNKLPYNENLEIDETRASSFYWKQIQETAKKSILL